MAKIARWGLALVLLLASLVLGRAQPLLYTVPFKAGDGKYLIYRIPALHTTRNKTLLAFAEGRASQRRAAGNIDIVLRRSLDGGQTWEPMQIVADLGDDFCGNPCVVHDPVKDRIWLAFTRSRGSDIESAIASGKVPGTQVWVTSSDDDGTTWAKPVNVSATTCKPTWGWYGTGPGAGLYLGDAKKGRLLIPAYHTEKGVYRAHCFCSDDHGATWRLGADAADHTSEPQVVLRDDGSLLMNARTIAGHGDHRTLLTSRDGGMTWKPAAGLTAHAAQDCQGCIYRSPRSGAKGKWDLLFTHPVSRKRIGVHAWISEDEGKTWPFAQKLWDGPSAYTAMARGPDGQVCALIECGKKNVYEQIAFVKFAPEWVKAGAAP